MEQVTTYEKAFTEGNTENSLKIQTAYTSLLFYKKSLYKKILDSFPKSKAT